MIQTNELRIGNWIIVQNPFLGKAARATVFNILPDDLMVYDESQHRFAADPSTSEPIPITPEILEAVGFEKEGLTTIAKDGLPVYFKLKAGELSALVFNLSTPINVPCKYVHQLQNLFFTLTGNELEIKF